MYSPAADSPAMSTTGFALVMPAPFGRLGVRVSGEFIHEIVFLPAEYPVSGPHNTLAEMAWRQLQRYLVDPDTPFELPLALRGSQFRRRVWTAISRIPRGRTLTYGELARDVESAPRAVGQACGDNPFPLIIPCHRVLARHGAGGFAHERGGYLLNAKHWLLQHESARPSGNEPFQPGLFQPGA